jgi:CubicO group peptidase (beta-lactamase class C family)
MEKSEVDGVMTRYLHKRTFTGCSIGCYFFDNNFKKKNFSYYNCGVTDICGNYLVTEKTFFDLASLTKPLVTSLCVFALLERAMISLNDRVGKYIPYAASPVRSISVRQLLFHCSGLPAHRHFHVDIAEKKPETPKKYLLEVLVREPLLNEPGGKTVYSDLGFMLLAAIIEIIAGESLSHFWQKEIAAPLHLEKDLFFPANEGIPAEFTAVTGFCKRTGKKLCGIVHDDNCREIGGICGHAGLFGSADGVLRLVAHLLHVFRGEEMHPALGHTPTDMLVKEPRQGSWWMGFDSPSPGYSSSGKLFTKNSFGHLGFTGTSFWFDVTRGVAIVVLTNRVIWEKSDFLIREFRPIIHDMLMMEFQKA